VIRLRVMRFAGGPRVAVALAATLVASAACSPAVPLVPHGPHPETGGVPPVVVDSRPPPVKVQIIPAAPDGKCQWSDGEWEWRSGEWRWREGLWLSSSPSCYFADAVFVWLPARNAPNGLLYYTRSQWYELRTNEHCETPVPCITETNGG
jgi:hypothetical protein